jgi:hypothetical protein
VKPSVVANLKETAAARYESFIYLARKIRGALMRLASEMIVVILIGHNLSAETVQMQCISVHSESCLCNAMDDYCQPGGPGQTRRPPEFRIPRLSALVGLN